MGVVRIDDKLLRQLRDFLKKDENKYKYGSVAAVINSMVYEKLNEKGVKNKR